MNLKKGPVNKRADLNEGNVSRLMHSSNSMVVPIAEKYSRWSSF